MGRLGEAAVARARVEAVVLLGRVVWLCFLGGMWIVEGQRLRCCFDPITSSPQCLGRKADVTAVMPAVRLADGIRLISTDLPRDVTGSWPCYGCYCCYGWAAGSRVEAFAVRGGEGQRRW